MNRIQGDDCPTLTLKGTFSAFMAAAAAEDEETERFRSLSWMRPGDSLPTVARAPESRVHRLVRLIGVIYSFAFIMGYLGISLIGDFVAQVAEVTFDNLKWSIGR